MNLGYAISTIIAGLVLLSLVALNSRIIQGSGEQTLYTMAKTHSDMIVDYIKEDLRTIGYGVDSTAITIASPNRIQFLAHADPLPNLRIIDWVFDEDTQLSARNINVSPLYRRQNVGTPNTAFDPLGDTSIEDIGIGVVRFNLQYLDSNREVIEPESSGTIDSSQLELICQIEVELIVESLDSYDANRFERSTWSGEITPFNLNCTTSPPLP